MAEDTKTCSLTDDEIIQLIHFHGSQSMYPDMQYAIERINYLNRRLKAEAKNSNSTVPSLPETPPTEKNPASW